MKGTQNPYLRFAKKLLPTRSVLSIVLLVVVIGGLFIPLTVSADHCEGLPPDLLCEAGHVIGGIVGSFFSGLLEFFASRMAALIGALVLGVTILANFFLVGLLFLAKEFMEFALAVSLTYRYTSGGGL